MEIKALYTRQEVAGIIKQTTFKIGKMVEDGTLKEVSGLITIESLKTIATDEMIKAFGAELDAKVTQSDIPEVKQLTELDKRIIELDKQLVEADKQLLLDEKTTRLAEKLKERDLPEVLKQRSELLDNRENELDNKSIEINSRETVVAENSAKIIEDRKLLDEDALELVNTAVKHQEENDRLKLEADQYALDIKSRADLYASESDAKAEEYERDIKLKADDYYSNKVKEADDYHSTKEKESVGYYNSQKKDADAKLKETFDIYNACMEIKFNLSNKALVVWNNRFIKMESLSKKCHMGQPYDRNWNDKEYDYDGYQVKIENQLSVIIEAFEKILPKTEIKKDDVKLI